MRVWQAARAPLFYGALLAAGTLLLQLIDWQRLAREQTESVTLFLVGAGFLAAGIVLGGRVFRRPIAPAFDGNPRVVATLGISPRELAVLEQLAAGRSNKEIARALHVSPNTIKTHIARLFEKLEAQRRTEAIARARALGILQ